MRRKRMTIDEREAAIVARGNVYKEMRAAHTIRHGRRFCDSIGVGVREENARVRSLVRRSKNRLELSARCATTESGEAFDIGFVARARR